MRILTCAEFPVFFPEKNPQIYLPPHGSPIKKPLLPPLLKVPVFAAVLSGPVVYFLLTPTVNAQIFAQRVIAGCESIPMLAIPFLFAIEP